MIKAAASTAILLDPWEPAKLTAMLALAEQLLAGREAHRAKLVEQQKPVPAEAEASVRLATALVAQWRWVVDADAGIVPPDGRAGPWGAWPDELADDTSHAAERARQRAGSDDPTLVDLAERCEVLAWYQHCEGLLHNRIVTVVDNVRYSRRWTAGRARLAA